MFVNLLFWSTFSTVIDKAVGNCRIQRLHSIQPIDKPNSWIIHLSFHRSQIRSKCLITTTSAFPGWIVRSSRRWTKTLLQRSWQIPIFWRRQESGPQQTAWRCREEVKSCTNLPVIRPSQEWILGPTQSDRAESFLFSWVGRRKDGSRVYEMKNDL